MRVVWGGSWGFVADEEDEDGMLSDSSVRVGAVVWLDCVIGESGCVLLVGTVWESRLGCC